MSNPKLNIKEETSTKKTRSPPKKTRVEQSVPKKKKLKLDADKAAEKAQHLRFGKAELTPDELSRLSKAQKREMYAAHAARSAVHREVDQYEDENVGVQALSEGEKAAETTHDIAKSRYARKLKKKAKMQGKKGTKTAKSSAREPTAAQDAGASGTSEGGSNWLSRWRQKQDIRQSYYAAARSGTAAQTAGGKAVSNGASAARSGVEQAVEKGKTAVSTAVKGLMNLQEKNDFYYIVLSYKDAAGKRKTKWEATGLSVKRNKKKAEALLLERRRNFMVPTAPAEIRLDDDILFSDFMLKWLEVAKSTIQITTYASYQGMVERVIVPYFRKRGIKLVDLKATDLQDFYNKQLERVKANSVIHYHANIHKALKYAVKIDLIPTNPADKVERPKKNEFKGSYYSADEIHALTEVAEGTKLEIPVLLASFYGLRRSEVLGLKWDAIDFEANTLEIKHIVTQASIDGKKVLVQADRAKTKSSLRTLPLVPPIRDRLLMLKGQQDTYRRLCGKSYNRDYLGYLCVDEIGNIIRPNYVSEQFPKLLEKNGLRPIRFHDLRHSCASLLLANGVPMKQIQEWLGHSDFSTTANIYAHLDYASKLSSAQAMLEGLGYGNASA